jgi:hypothetical protein
MVVRAGFDGLGGLAGRLPIMVWVTTTMLGVAVFAWTLRRPQRAEDSPLAAALSMVASARGAFLRDVTDRHESVGEPTATIEADPAAEAPLPFGLHTADLSGNRPTGWQSRPPLRFNSAPAGDVVRRRITSRLVRLSDGPDDLRSREIMRLDRGDEIEIVGQDGSILQVRTPTGAIGWIPTISIIG